MNQTNTTLRGIGNSEVDRVFTVPVLGKTQGTAPAVILLNPQFGHNVGNVLRACSCWDVGVDQLWWTGERVKMDVAEREENRGRLPREERMKGYKAVKLFNHDRPLDFFTDIVPVAIELRPGSENLLEFEHPENAVYVFGPEDGSVDHNWRRQCHRFVQIPTRHCLNLAAATNIVLYDRYRKMVQVQGYCPRPEDVLAENRGPL